MPCENGKKYFGDDHKIRWKISNARECQDLCQEYQTTCHYWTWEIYNWDLKEHGVCWKIPSKNNVENNAYTISGETNCVISDTPPKGMGKILIILFLFLIFQNDLIYILPQIM